MQPNEGYQHIAHRFQRRENIRKRRQENRELHKEMKVERDSFANTKSEDITKLEEQLSLELKNDIQL